ncbi:glycosyltransferase [Caulobacter segnis]
MRAERKALARARRRARRRNLPPSLPVTIVGFHAAPFTAWARVRACWRGAWPTQAFPRARSTFPPTSASRSTCPSSFPPPSAAERGVVIAHQSARAAALGPGDRGVSAGGSTPHRLLGLGAGGRAADWAPAFDLVDEVWTPSAFAADAIRKIAPARVKVSPAPYPLYLNPRPAPDRARFGLPEDVVAVLMAFDLRSTAQRKNPHAALRAFRAARAATDRPALLICKIVGADLYPETLARLRESVADDPSIRLMTESLSADDMARLTASSDIVLSLHRSEGYGLLLAEAIWLGKPTLATGWSSNVEFMDPASSQLADYALIPVEGDGHIYRTGRWADADVDDAAAKLARMIADDGWRKDMAAATAHNGHVSFDRAAWLRMTRGLLPV